MFSSWAKPCSNINVMGLLCRLGCGSTTMRWLEPSRCALTKWSKLRHQTRRNPRWPSPIRASTSPPPSTTSPTSDSLPGCPRPQMAFTGSTTGRSPPPGCLVPRCTRSVNYSVHEECTWIFVDFVESSISPGQNSYRKTGKPLEESFKKKCSSVLYCACIILHALKSLYSVYLCIPLHRMDSFDKTHLLSLDG